MAAPPPSGAGALRALMRAVLRAHRERLPPPLRSLGDSYFKSEVRRHAAAKTTAPQWAEFGQQWTAYLASLSGRGDLAAPAGAAAPPLHEAREEEMSPEQRAQLAALRDAAARLGGDGGGGDPSAPNG